ncbi:MAG: DUF2283 domain-containing protein [Aquificaceae bacterium]|jgi:uncharacterized protein YuzE|uniref:DUF2283 domain-containing protein n=1 Tax=Hydrogenobacter sp. Uz 6-8 TaxID=3384828 RepID=UPI000F263792|nr:MAG: DUF2283 domain-containing protein [Aquificota bacterium]
MRITYDPVADAVYVYLREVETVRVARTEEIAEGILVDYDHEGNPVGIEILWLKERKADLSTITTTIYSHSASG